jgi:hypothetical protein
MRNLHLISNISKLTKTKTKTRFNKNNYEIGFLQVNTEESGETDAGVAFLNAFNYITSVKEEPYEALSFITDVYNKVLSMIQFKILFSHRYLPYDQIKQIKL